MSLNIYPSKVGETANLKISFTNEIGEVIETQNILNVSGPNLRTTENNGEHLFLRSTNDLFLCYLEE